MALRAYKLRPEYEGALVGGLIRTGADSEADIKDLLDSGNGEILTEDPMLQSILDNYYGAHGLLLQAYAVDGESREPIDVTITTSTVVSVPVASAPPAGGDQSAAAGQSASNVPNAQHDTTQSDYATFTVEELRDTLAERGVAFSARANKQELVAALDENDRMRQEGVGSGS